VRGAGRLRARSLPDDGGRDTSNQLLRVYLTDARDVGARMLIGPCQDQNGNAIYSQDGANSVNGFYLTLDAAVHHFGFYRDEHRRHSEGRDVRGRAALPSGRHDRGAGFLSRYAPDELNPAYRRYFINQMPCGNTGNDGATVPITAMAKLEFIPANRDTDFLIVGNIPALDRGMQSHPLLGHGRAEARLLEAKATAKPSNI
jgi:hypothetical protein